MAKDDQTFLNVLLFFSCVACSPHEGVLYSLGFCLTQASALLFKRYGVLSTHKNTRVRVSSFRARIGEQRRSRYALAKPGTERVPCHATHHGYRAPFMVQSAILLSKQKRVSVVAGKIPLFRGVTFLATKSLWEGVCRFCSRSFSPWMHGAEHRPSKSFDDKRGERKRLWAGARKLGCCICTRRDAVFCNTRQ